MKKSFSILMCTVLLLSCIVTGIVGQNIYALEDQNGEKISITKEFALDRIIIATKDNATKAITFDSNGVTLIKYLMHKDSMLKSVDNGYSIGLYSISAKSTNEVLDLIKKISQDPSVVYAEPDYILKALVTTPNDTYYNNLYGMTKIKANMAWDYATGSSSVVVGVIDSGIDYNHNDLAGNIWTNPGEIPNNNIDDDNNGYVDDVYGWNFYSNTNNPMDDNSHGTHCSGTIGARGNNNQGVVGVAWNVKLAALKFLDASGSGYSSGAISAINYATTMNFPITNNSWGGGSYSQALYDAIDAYQGLFVAAAGNNYLNNNDTNPVYPSSYTCDNIIAVANTNSSDALVSSSNYGLTSVDLAAPGYNIYSTIPNNSYGYKTGTSMATPHVAGAAALLKGYDPTLTTAQLKSFILNNVDLVSSLSNRVSTGGRLNIYNSLIDLMY